MKPSKSLKYDFRTLIMTGLGCSSQSNAWPPSYLLGPSGKKKNNPNAYKPQPPSPCPAMKSEFSSWSWCLWRSSQSSTSSQAYQAYIPFKWNLLPPRHCRQDGLPKNHGLVEPSRASTKKGLARGEAGPRSGRPAKRRKV